MSFLPITIALILLSFSSCRKNPSASKQTKSVSLVDGCQEFRLDLIAGDLNGVKPVLSQSEIKEWFSCYSSSIPDGSSEGCGGGIFYPEYGFIFYTFGDYLEVDSIFKGTVSHDLMGKSREECAVVFGAPYQTRYTGEFPSIDFFSTAYGCLRIHYAEDKIVLISLHYSECADIVLCE